MFLALADPTRREVIGALGAGPASVGELAQSFSISLPSFLKHIRALEDCGLIRTEKTGRVRTCTLEPERLAVAADWIDEQRHAWARRDDDRAQGEPQSG